MAAAAAVVATVAGRVYSTLHGPRVAPACCQGAPAASCALQRQSQQHAYSSSGSQPSSRYVSTPDFQSGFPFTHLPDCPLLHSHHSSCLVVGSAAVSPRVLQPVGLRGLPGDNGGVGGGGGPRVRGGEGLGFTVLPWDVGRGTMVGGMGGRAVGSR